MFGIDTLPGGYVPQQVAILPGDSIVLLQTQGTLFSARVTGDSTIRVIDRLKIGWARELIEEFEVRGTRLIWRTFTSVYSAEVSPEGMFTIEGNIDLGSVCYDVAGTRRDRIYAVTTDTLYAMDFTIPASPEFLSRISYKAEGLAVVNNERIITFDSVITVFDMSNPRTPRLLDTLHLGHGVVAWEAEVRDSLIVLCCREGGTFVIVMRGDSLYHACRVEARSTDALWTDSGLLLTTLDKTSEVVIEWGTPEIADSRFEWCTPERLNVFGMPGTSLIYTGKAIIIGSGILVRGTGVTLPFIHFTDIDPVFPPTIIASQALWITGPIMGMDFNGGVLAIQAYNNDKRMYTLVRNDSLKPVGYVDGLAHGTGRFFFLDTLLMFSAEMYRNFEVWKFRFATAGLESDVEPSERIGDALTMQLLPTVTRERTTVVVTTPTPLQYTLALYNMLGQELEKVELSVEPGFHTFHLDLRSLPVGTYFLLLQSEREQIIQQLRRVR
jgi:hypothetical protein